MSFLDTISEKIQETETYFQNIQASMEKLRQELLFVQGKHKALSELKEQHEKQDSDESEITQDDVKTIDQE